MYILMFLDSLITDNFPMLISTSFIVSLSSSIFPKNLNQLKYDGRIEVLKLFHLLIWLLKEILHWSAFLAIPKCGS